MKTQIDLRFVCCSFACFAALGVGTYLLNHWQVQRQAGIILDKAQEAKSKGDLDKAIDLYEKYLALAPRDIDAQAQYGSLLAEAHTYDAAAQVFEAVLRRDPARSDVRRKAVTAAMATNRVPDARDHLENYLLKQFPDDAELLDLEGRCLVLSGDYLAAGRSFAAAIERDPTRSGAYTQLIAVLSQHRGDLERDREKWLAPLPRPQRTALLQDKDWAEKTADFWTDRLVESNPKDPQAYLFRGYRRYGKQLFDGAVQDAEAALQLHADAPRALHLAAVSCLATKQADKARDYAARGIKAAPKDAGMYDILAQVDLARQKPDEALKWLQMGVDADGPPQLWWKLGTIQIAQGKLDEARQTAQGIRKKVFPRMDMPSAAAPVEPGLYADLLEAQIEQIQGHWQEATKRFRQIGLGLKSVPDLAKEAFFALGNSYEQLADTQRALAAYRQAVDADPMWRPAREAVAASLQALGRSDEALEAQGALARLKDAPLAAWATLIRWSIARTSRLSADRRDWSEVIELLNQLARSTPQSPAVPLLRAELLMAQDRAAEAARLIETEKNKDPKEIAFWIALVDLAVRDNQWDRARESLEAAEKQFGDRAVLRLARARYLVRKGEKGAAEAIRKLAEKCKDFSAQDQAQVWRELVWASLAVDDLPQAERLCQLLVAQLPGDLGVRLDLFDLAAQANDVKLMDAALEEIRRVESNGPIWHYATALRLMFSAAEQRDMHGAKTEPSRRNAMSTEAAGNTGAPSAADKQRQAVLRQALDHLAESLQARPNWFRAVRFEGMIYEELHQDDAALAKYQEAIRQGENSPDVARRALRLLYGKGEYAPANALLRQLEGNQVPFSTELFREQSRVLGGLQDYAGALKAAERAATDSKDYRDYLWLGQLLSIVGQRAEAEKALQQASLLGEKAPETWVALVQFFVRTGQKDSAEKALASAREKIPASDAPLALGGCLEILGKTDEAGRQYALALKQRPNDPGVVRNVAISYVRQGDLPKAADQFLRIINGQVPSTPRQVAEARRDLARVRADQGGYANLLEALGLVDQNLAAAPASAADLRLKARFLATHPQPARRREATAIFEKLVEDPKNAAAEDRFRLAQLYLATGDWAKARRQMLALLATQGNQPQYVAAYAQALLDHNELGEAEPWIDRLEQTAPDNPRAAQLRAEVQFRTGHIDETLATLTKFMEKAPRGSADRLARVLGAAAELESMGSRPGNMAGTPVAAVAKDKAEGLYRQYVKEDPKRGSVLVGFLARQKRVDEALELAAEAWKAAGPPQIAANGELLLRQPEISPVQVDRLAEVLTAALKKHDRAVPLLMALAQVREKQAKYAEAETLYREVLQNDARSVPTLNNLAGLLALGGRQLNEAKNLIEQAIVDTGPQPYLLDTRASVYLALGQAEKALVDIQAVLDQQPAPNRYFHLALVLRKLGRKAEAADALMKAQGMQIRPESLHPLEQPVYAELVRELQ